MIGRRSNDNRTYVELKLLNRAVDCGVIDDDNRTYVELKLKIHALRVRSTYNDNRTYVELKFRAGYRSTYRGA